MSPGASARRRTCLGGPLSPGDHDIMFAMPKGPRGAFAFVHAGEHVAPLAVAVVGFVAELEHQCLYKHAPTRRNAALARWRW